MHVIAMQSCVGSLRLRRLLLHAAMVMGFAVLALGLARGDFVQAAECCPGFADGPREVTAEVRDNGNPLAQPTGVTIDKDQNKLKFNTPLWVLGAEVSVPQDCPGHWVGFAQLMTRYTAGITLRFCDGSGDATVEKTVTDPYWDVNSLSNCPWYDGPGRGPVFVKAGHRDRITMTDQPHAEWTVELASLETYPASYEQLLRFTQYVLAVAAGDEIPAPKEGESDYHPGSDGYNENNPWPYATDAVEEKEAPKEYVGQIAYRILAEREVTLHYTWTVDKEVTTCDKFKERFERQDVTLYKRETGSEHSWQVAWTPVNCNPLEGPPCGEKTAAQAIADAWSGQ